MPTSPDVVGRLREIGADCLVVIAFGQKLSDELLGVARFGGINLHSSLLPKYRGAAPINWAVINNDPEAGVSVIEVTHVMDGGAILAQAATPVGRAETAGELHDRLAAPGRRWCRRCSKRWPTARRSARGRTRPWPPGRRSCGGTWRGWIGANRQRWRAPRVRGLSPWPGVAVELIDATAKVRTQATILKCQARAGRAAGASPVRRRPRGPDGRLRQRKRGDHHDPTRGQTPDGVGGVCQRLWIWPGRTVAKRGRGAGEQA